MRGAGIYQKGDPMKVLAPIPPPWLSKMLGQHLHRTQGTSDRSTAVIPNCKPRKRPACPAWCLASCLAPAFLQGKQQGKIPFTIASMVRHCASRFEQRVALPIYASSVFFSDKPRTNRPSPEQSAVLMKRTDARGDYL